MINLAKFAPYFDKRGILCHIQSYGFDAGDAPLRAGMLALLARRLYLTSYIPLLGPQLNVFHPEPDVFRRYDSNAPDAGRPGVRDFATWSNPQVFSRDQAMGLAMALGVHRMPLSDLVRYLLKRYSRTANGDFVFWHWNILFRAGTFRRDLYPLVAFFDLFFVLGIFINEWRRHAGKPKYSDETFSYFVGLQSEMFQPTFVSAFGVWLQKRFGYQARAANYFRNNPTAPPLHDLIERIK